MVVQRAPFLSPVALHSFINPFPSPAGTLTPSKVRTASVLRHPALSKVPGTEEALAERLLRKWVCSISAISLSTCSRVVGSLWVPPGPFPWRGRAPAEEVLGQSGVGGACPVLSVFSAALWEWAAGLLAGSLCSDAQPPSRQTD